MNIASEVAALVDQAMDTATKALTANKSGWEGVIEVKPMDDGGIAYRFGVKVPLVDGDLGKMTAAFQAVTAVIEQNCTMHIVRTAPMFEAETDFLSDTIWADGYMRGHMIGVGLGVGPAARSAPPPSGRVVMSAGR